MNTLLLDTVTWDLLVDANGNIAMAIDPYSVAQDVASAVRVFQGEQFYDTTAGVPYFQDILGKFPPLSLVKAEIAAAAALVPGCNNPQIFLSQVQNRVLSGQIVFTDSNGATQTAMIGSINASVPLFDTLGNPVTNSLGTRLVGNFT